MTGRIVRCIVLSVSTMVAKYGFECSQTQQIRELSVHVKKVYGIQFLYFYYHWLQLKLQEKAVVRLQWLVHKINGTYI